MLRFILDENKIDIFPKVLILFICLFYPVNSFSEIRLHTISRRSPPGLKSPSKLWWAKEITPNLFVAGRPTVRQIKYAAEGGFKSLVSLFPYGDNERGDFGREYLPTTKEAAYVAKQVGLQFVTALNSTDDWATRSSVTKLGIALDNLPQPVLLHCDRGYTISFATIMYLINKTIHDNTFKPRVNAKRFYDMTKVLGMPFNMDCTKRTLSEITGEEINEDIIPILDNEPDDWFDMWPAKPVLKNWYIAGQILTGYISEIKYAGFASVVNLRLGTTHNGLPSQETVNLLNIKDHPIQYGDNRRQSMESLSRYVVDKSKSNSYISEESDTNFESTNPLEFGDDNGYNETLERMAFKKAKRPYYHMPIDPKVPFSAKLFEKYQHDLLEIGKNGPVLVHCSDMNRAGCIAVLAAALQHKKDLKWSLQKLGELGFEVGPTKQKDVFYMYKSILHPKDINRTEKDEL